MVEHWHKLPRQVVGTSALQISTNPTGHSLKPALAEPAQSRRVGWMISRDDLQPQGFSDSTRLLL